jgi:hypothetical protein
MKLTKDLLDYASDVLNQLKERKHDVTWRKRTEDFVDLLPNPPFIPRSCDKEYDRLGVALWNLSTKLRRETNVDTVRDLCLLRCFALFMLESWRLAQVSKDGTTVRVFHIALKCAKFCISCEEYRLALKALECAAIHEEDLGTSGRMSGLGEPGMRTRYYMLRILLVSIE